MSESPALREEQLVHQVYNEIAAHFSQTRYKPWPIVTEFLEEQPVGSVGIDVGCGNGKYLAVNPRVFVIGSDRSDGLITCARGINEEYNVVVADGLALPHRDGSFDFAISIAVVHHWTTRERRVAAIAHIISKLRVGGRVLVYCWALEQGSSRRGYHEGMEQDVLVPWVLHGTGEKEKNKKKKLEGTSDKGSLREKPDLSGIPPRERAAAVDQWKREQEAKRKERLAAAESHKSASTAADPTKYRFYHLYREGELEEDCISAGATVLRSGYERDNWYVVAEKPLV
ncbi:tRNA (carboxymethyluridine(34)-5-O)-methyltransferase KNAG_0B03590 [Huiozyma naganishii CBS 8797]|uniref:Methyltransferase type 11 domain-containing protein n=1 Tax=Huiozyma naganishii (strain ATCC MYA-139 / BCRC 22969 / CBS 8797 / KCTC 17520 / NBRC 10181 / NCYC 3082 / Yp74L-3) TaxID=1071383 RepID=J7S4U0_HUIN7|nr:hypothetical protein KNAG_0B03590 [Kazachstania naganishii CBS 8797]CCK68801.1 hypothetical protein KNAG_0B03590 [Kazachstania naganishii CBS 8797]